MSRSTRALPVSGAAGALVLAALIVGCGEGDPGGPAPIPADPGPVLPIDAGVDAPPLPEAGPLKRTITMRNPLGGPADNLVADGDFELSTVSDGRFPQSGWRGFTGGGSAQASVKAETGGLCRTGLRCAVLERDLLLFGRATAAPEEKAHVASIWAKVPAGASCDVVTVLLVGCDSFASLKKLTADPAPGEDGWCEYGATLPERDSSICFYAEAELSPEQVVLVDSAVMIPESAAASMKSLAIWVPPPEIAARVASVQEQVRKSMPLSSPRPHHGARARPVW